MNSQCTLHLNPIVILSSRSRSLIRRQGGPLSVLGFPLLLAASLALLACGNPKAKTPEPGSVSTEVEATAEASDLDTAVEDLLAAACEHKIPTYTCDECRYEVGVAKASDDLFDPAEGGALRTMILGSRPFAGGKALNGEVRLNEEKAVFIGPKAPGIVRAVRCDLGSNVGAGEVLFEVDSPDLSRAKADYLRGLAAEELARATAGREADLYEKKICPQKDYLEAQAALKGAEAERKAAEGLLQNYGLTPADIASLAMDGPEAASGLMKVRAPFAGTILERSLSLGALVQPGDRSLLMADTSRVWVLTDLYEREVAAVLEAQGRSPVSAEVTVAAYPQRTFRGTVERISGTRDEATRTARARVVVENPGNLLRAGMFARVTLLLEDSDAPLAVPEAAVLEDAGRSFVFVHLDGPYYIRRPVEAGRTSEGWVAISGAVKAGDVIVSEGAFLLKSDVLRSKMGAGCAD